MRKIIFLDFDGVLHGERDPIFAKLPQFEQYALQMPEVEIVISSAWRETRGFDKLKAPFQPAIQQRIIGITPSLDGGYLPGGRQREIETYLQNAQLWKHNADWIALDDIGFFFDPDCPYLILVDGAHGFAEQHGKALLEWYTKHA